MINLPIEIQLQVFQYCEDDMKNVAMVSKQLYYTFDRYKDVISSNILNSYFGIFEECIKVQNSYKILQKIKKTYNYLLSETALNIPYSNIMLEADASFINPFDKALYEAAGKNDLDIMDFVLSLPIYYCLQPFMSYTISNLKNAGVDIDAVVIDDDINIFAYAVIKNQVESAKYIFALSKNTDKIEEGFFGEDELDHNDIFTCIDLSIKNRCVETFQYLIQYHTGQFPTVIDFIKENYISDLKEFVINALGGIGL